MWPIFEQALTRYQELEEQLGDPTVVADRARFTRTAKEHGTLAKRVKPYLEYKKVTEDLAQAQALLEAETDPVIDLRQLGDAHGEAPRRVPTRRWRRIG